MQQLDSLPSNYSIAVIPECDYIGYSLMNIDELDLMLLQVLQEPITINEVLNEAKSAFDPVELEDCSDEFETLIFGRIKIALQQKTIKLVM